MVFLNSKFLFKLTAAVLVFVFIFQPLAPALAQETINDSLDYASPASPALNTAEPDAINSSDITSSNSTVPDVQIPADIQSPPENSQSDSSVVPQDSGKTVDMPSDQNDEQNNKDAATKGKAMAAPSSGQGSSSQTQTSSSQLTQKLPEIDKNTGALSYNYPISVPPGRNNLQPSLALSYNSSLNEQNSIVGYGWSLIIPYIQRLNKTGTDTLYGANYFYSSLDGELAAVGGSSYIPRTENGSFNKYTFQNNQWLIIAKDGTQYKFGYESASRQDDPANTNNVYKWMLQEIRDTNDNYVSYVYFKDVGQIYPSSIKYTGSGNTDGIFNIDFQRIFRADNFVSYATGFAVNSNYLISEIDSKINGNWVSKYVLSYTKSQNINRSLLNSITVSGKDDIGNITTPPPTTFNYQSNNSGWTPADASWNIPPAPEGNWDLALRPPAFVDLNGDSLPDLAISAEIWTQVENSSIRSIKSYEYINNGHG